MRLPSASLYHIVTLRITYKHAGRHIRPGKTSQWLLSVLLTSPGAQSFLCHFHIVYLVPLGIRPSCIDSHKWKT
jgi:hypothetical protein